MIKSDTLPNCLNGKLYKRWERVRTITDGATIIASKTDAKGSNIQLLLTENGRKRELFYPDEKIMDVLDSKGTKRVYKYQRVDSETIKGQMIAGEDKDGRAPLILAAKWILKNMTPKKLILKINKNHPQSQIFVPKEGPDGTPIYTGKIDKLHVTEILAKDFDKTAIPIPKTILLKTVNGSTEPVISKSGNGNIMVAKHFGLESEVLGQNLQTIV